MYSNKKDNLKSTPNNSSQSNNQSNLKHLTILKIIKGDDMFPSICSDEKLLLDKESTPKIGNVILFKNRFGLNIAHRLICIVGRYYFTRGDNCDFLNFPCKKKDILGVITKKHRKICSSDLLKISLRIFLTYFVIYSKLFNIRNKKQFILLKAISRYIIPIEGIYYRDDNQGDLVNSLLYNIKGLSNNNIKSKYYIRKLKDNRILKENNKNKIIQYSDIDSKHALLSYCGTIFENRTLTLYDIMYLKNKLSEIDIDNIKIKNQEEYDILGFPLIALYILDLKYCKSNKKDKSQIISPKYTLKLKKFINLHYKKELIIVKKYLDNIDYQFPVRLYHFYKEMETFKIYSYLSAPIGYDKTNSNYGILSPFIWIIFKIKKYNMNKYCKKKYTLKGNI